MTSPAPVQLFVVRVESDVTAVAVVDTGRDRVERALRFSGGLEAVDDRIEEIVDASMPGGLPGSSAAAFVTARARMRESITAARMRLVEDESTVVSVRFPGRTTFVTLERSAVVDALAPQIAELLAALDELGAGAGSTIVPLEGVATIPGLLEALPGRLDEPTDARADELRALLDGMDWDRTAEGVTAERTPVADTPPATQTAVSISVVPRLGPSVPPAVVSLRRTWPAAAAVVILLGAGGAAAAIGLGDRPDDLVRPAVAGTTQGGGDLGSSAADALVPTDPGGAAGTSEGGAPHPGDPAGGDPGAPKKTAGSAPSPGSGGSGAAGSGSAPNPAPAPVSTTAPAPATSSPPASDPPAGVPATDPPAVPDPPVPDPSPTDPGAPGDAGGSGDSGLLGGVLGGLLTILP